jgi:opacity protein-like surface antigen
MKKILLIAALVGLSAAAQAKMLAFGVKAGVNMPHFKTDLNVDSKADLGFHAGVFGQLNIPIIGLGVQPELLYLNQSLSRIDASGKQSKSASSYLDVPLNVTWGIDLKVIRPFIALTPYVRYSFSNVKTYVVSSTSSSLVEEQKLNKFDYGVGGGVGIDLFSKLQLMGRYSWGLSDLVSSGNYKVQSFIVSLGYIF